MVRERSMMRRQLVRRGALSAGVLLMVALLGMVNYLGWKYFKRFDWTSSELYSLSEKTRNVLRDLKKDVDVVVFLSPAQGGLLEPTKELLARYASASRHVTVRFVDAEKNPLEARPLIQQYGIAASGVVVASGSDKRIIDSAELAEMDYSPVQLGQPAQITAYKGEQAFTSAILQVTEGRRPKILFTTGHGERSLDDQGPHGLSGAQQLLGRDNAVVEEWAPLGKSEVPPGTDLLVVAGPTGSFVQPELDLFSRFLSQGGRMLLLLDPVLSPSAASGVIPTGLESWLAGNGIKAGSSFVTDPPNQLQFFGPETLFVSQFGDHPITKPLSQGGLRVLVTLARPVEKGAEAGMKVSELLRTSAEAWGETDFVHLDRIERNSSDQAGALSLGVVAESAVAPGGKKAARLVVFGDSDFATNQLLEANLANEMLLSNALNWLDEREGLIGIPPKKTEQVHLSLAPSELRTIWLSTIVFLPLIAAICGTFVYFRRRR